MLFIRGGERGLGPGHGDEFGMDMDVEVKMDDDNTHWDIWLSHSSEADLSLCHCHLQRSTPRVQVASERRYSDADKSSSLQLEDFTS